MAGHEAEELEEERRARLAAESQAAAYQAEVRLLRGELERFRAVPTRFEGLVERDCGDHRGLGETRAWCVLCHEYCYEDNPCRGCEAPRLRRRAEHEQLP